MPPSKPKTPQKAVNAKTPTKAPSPIKRGKGRPSTFDPAVAEAICARLSKGEPLASICRDPGMPPVRTVSEWKARQETFSADFARARDEGFDAIALDCLEIADMTGRDTKLTDAGNSIPDSEWIARSRLRVETRLKLLAKWCPKRYGEKLEVESSGEARLRVIIVGGDSEDEQPA